MKVSEKEFWEILRENAGLYSRTARAIEKQFNVSYSRQAVKERAEKDLGRLSDIEDQNFDVAVVDFAMPGINGIETLKQIKEKRPDIEVIMLTGQGTIQSGIEAMKHGAIDYLEKPVDLNILMEKIRLAKQQRMLVLEKKSADEVRNILKSKSW